MNAPRLLIAESERFSPTAIERLSERCEVTAADLSRPELLEAVQDVQVLWVRLRHRIDREVLEKAKELRLLASPTTGLNHIDLEAAAEKGVRVLSLRGEVDFLREVRATAEHTIGLMLALLRSIPAAVEDVRRGHWQRDLFRGFELHEKTVGIVGYGRLGRLVAHTVAAFGARVVVTDPSLAKGDLLEGVTATTLGDLLGQSDIVSLHVNLTPETAGMFARQEFEQMRHGSWLVNTARGELVDEGALLDALRSGRVRGAALDVLHDEDAGGMQHSELVRFAQTHDQLIITPHIGGCTNESMAKTELFLAEKVCAALRELAEREPG